jgi:HEAT repeat protein
MALSQHKRLIVVLAVGAALAAAIIVLLWQDSTDALIRQAQSGPTAVRLDAIRNLESRGPDRAAGALADMTRDQDTEVACRAVEVVARLRRPEDVPRLKAAAQDPRPRVREAGVIAIGRSGGREAAPVLAAAFQDVAPEVRAAASNVVGLRLDWDSMPQILLALDDQSERVRRAAGVAVRRLWQRDYGYRAEDPPEKRRPVVAHIRADWEAFRQSPLYEQMKRPKEKRP